MEVEWKLEMEMKSNWKHDLIADMHSPSKCKIRILLAFFCSYVSWNETGQLEGL